MILSQIRILAKVRGDIMNALGDDNDIKDYKTNTTLKNFKKYRKK